MATAGQISQGMAAVFFSRETIVVLSEMIYGRFSSRSVTAGVKNVGRKNIAKVVSQRLTMLPAVIIIR